MLLDKIKSISSKDYPKNILELKNRKVRFMKKTQGTKESVEKSILDFCKTHNLYLRR